MKKKSCTIYPAQRLSTILEVPPDKSISHRLALFAGMAKGSSVIHNFLQAEDTLSTLNCLTACGVRVTNSKNCVTIESNGIRHFTSNKILNCRNSGTTARLMMGMLAGAQGTFRLEGDSSLQRRPMQRVLVPLSQMGAHFEGTSIPLQVQGTFPLRPISFRSTIASAQLKSSLLLAALSAEGESCYTEPHLSRDHSERLLPLFGVSLKRKGETIQLKGPQSLSPTNAHVPGDISSASFFILLAILSPESKICIQNVGLNPTRIAFLKALKKMGGNLSWKIKQAEPEPMGDVVASSSNLHGITITAGDVPTMIDEIPLLGLAGVFAKGITEVRGAQELRVKESDRIAQLVSGLRAMGASIKEREDGFSVSGPTPLEGKPFAPFRDHRMTMLFAIAAASASSPSCLQESNDVAISFPSFFTLLRKCGVHVEI